MVTSLSTISIHTFWHTASSVHTSASRFAGLSKTIGFSLDQMNIDEYYSVYFILLQYDGGLLMTTNSWEFKTMCFPNRFHSPTLLSDHCCYMISQTPTSTQFLHEVLTVDVERETYFMSMSLAPANTPEFCTHQPSLC